MSASLAQRDVGAFRAVLAERAGLWFGDDKLSSLRDVLSLRVRELRLDAASTYLAHLQANDQELASLARLLTVSETYFLRDPSQFRALAAWLRERAPGRQLHLLSAGCSSGEEAYSLAITVRETLADLSDTNVSILGMDLNPEVLERARAGVYSAWSLRETPEPIRQRYFREQGSHYVLAERIRERVRFELRNLAQPGPDPAMRGRFDVIFCRNVLMYFSEAAARRVVARLASWLAVGGCLFLGHAETLRGLSAAFRIEQAHGAFYYQLREGAGTCAPRTDDPQDVADGQRWVESISRASRRIAHLSRNLLRSHGGSQPAPAPGVHVAAEPAADGLAEVVALMARERFQEALQQLVGLSVDEADQRQALLLRALLHLSLGELEDAQQACGSLLALDDLHAGAHYVRAICHEQRGDHAAAVDQCQVAIYLDSDFAMPHLQLGRLARRAADLPRARRELALALELLAREDAARIRLFGGGFGREALMQLCRAELKSLGAMA